MRAVWPIVGSSPEFVSYPPHYRTHHRLCWLLVESDSGSSLDGLGVPGGGRNRECRWQAGERVMSIAQTTNVRCRTYLKLLQSSGETVQTTINRTRVEFTIYP